MAQQGLRLKSGPEPFDCPRVRSVLTTLPVRHPGGGSMRAGLRSAGERPRAWASPPRVQCPRTGWRRQRAGPVACLPGRAGPMATPAGPRERSDPDSPIGCRPVSGRARSPADRPGADPTSGPDPSRGDVGRRTGPGGDRRGRARARAKTRNLAGPQRFWPDPNGS